MLKVKLIKVTCFSDPEFLKNSATVCKIPVGEIKVFFSQNFADHSVRSTDKETDKSLGTYL
jgi:hypothetical protein